MGFYYICDKINIVVDIKTEIASVIEQSLANFTGAKINFLIEKPQNESFGDYSSNAALVASKILNKNPFDLAKQIVVLLNTKYKIQNQGSGRLREAFQKLTA